MTRHKVGTSPTRSGRGFGPLAASQRRHDLNVDRSSAVQAPAGDDDTLPTYWGESTRRWVNVDGGGRLMVVARKTTAARKPTAKKQTATRSSRAVTTKPMKPEVRQLAASIVGHAVDKAMASEKLGVRLTNTRELAGARQGMSAALKMDDGSRVVVTVVSKSK
jgi:hypothetical protein